MSFFVNFAQNYPWPKSTFPNVTVLLCVWFIYSFCFVKYVFLFSIHAGRFWLLVVSRSHFFFVTLRCHRLRIKFLLALHGKHFTFHIILILYYCLVRRSCSCTTRTSLVRVAKDWPLAPIRLLVLFIVHVHKPFILPLPVVKILLFLV